MSKVTNLILLTGLGESEEYLTESFRKFKVQGEPFNIVWIDDKTLPSAWYGGTKHFEANVFIGAYNYLDLPSLITFLKSEVKWEDPTYVQLLVQEQDDLKFKLIDIFPEE